MDATRPASPDQRPPGPRPRLLRPSLTSLTGGGNELLPCARRRGASRPRKFRGTPAPPWLAAAGTDMLGRTPQPEDPRSTQQIGRDTRSTPIMAAVDELIDRCGSPTGGRSGSRITTPRGPATPRCPRPSASSSPRRSSRRTSRRWPRPRTGSTRPIAGRSSSILQAMDAAGKDSTIKHVMSGVNPQGCEVTSFKHPSAEELDHNFLWRYARRMPERGRIGIFNRSYYEEVLVVRVHPELVQAEHIPDGQDRRRFLGRPLRRHQRLRAAPDPQRHDHPQVLPPPFQGRAAQAVPQAAQGPEEAVEVLARRPGRARLLGRLHEGVRGRHQRDQHQVGPLVHHPGRPQVGQPAGSSPGS